MIRVVERIKSAFGLRTWQVEAAFVATLLIVVALLSGKGAREWLGVFAVFFTWSHASVADRLVESAAAARSSAAHCHRWAGRYYWAKETLWFGYFVWLGAWSAVAGCVLFLAWPLWRKAWRSAGPSQRQGGAP